MFFIKLFLFNNINIGLSSFSNEILIVCLYRRLLKTWILWKSVLLICLKLGVKVWLAMILLFVGFEFEDEWREIIKLVVCNLFFKVCVLFIHRQVISCVKYALRIAFDFLYVAPLLEPFYDLFCSFDYSCWTNSSYIWTGSIKNYNMASILLNLTPEVYSFLLNL